MAYKEFDLETGRMKAAGSYVQNTENTNLKKCGSSE